MYQDTLEDFRKFKIAECLENGDDISKEVNEELFYSHVLDYVNDYYDNMCLIVNKRFFNATELLSASIAEDPDFELWQFKDGEFIEWSYQDVDDVKIIGYNYHYNIKGERIVTFALEDNDSSFYIFKKI